MIKKLDPFSQEFVPCPKSSSDRIGKYFTCYDEKRQKWITCDQCTLPKQYSARS